MEGKKNSWEFCVHLCFVPPNSRIKLENYWTWKRWRCCGCLTSRSSEYWLRILVTDGMNFFFKRRWKTLSQIWSYPWLDPYFRQYFAGGVGNAQLGCWGGMFSWGWHVQWGCSVGSDIVNGGVCSVGSGMWGARWGWFDLCPDLLDGPQGALSEGEGQTKVSASLNHGLLQSCFKPFSKEVKKKTFFCFSGSTLKCPFPLGNTNSLLIALL